MVGPFAVIIDCMIELVAPEKKIDKHFDNLNTLMSKFTNDVNDCFEQVVARFESVGSRLGRIEADLTWAS
jgi:hypothetical protein